MGSVIGWDVGGAHLKAARLERDGAGAARVMEVIQIPSPLWLGLDRLVQAITEARDQIGEADRHAATMTGELADLFASRAEGVARLATVLRDALAPAPLLLYAGPDGMVPPEAASRHAGAIASANWHATAVLAARYAVDALLVDIGSTTADLVPIAGGAPVQVGWTDAERLACGELVYTGLTRSFVMALCARAPVAGTWTPLAGEYFASSADVYRVLGELPDGVDQLPAADGREKSVPASRARLARMIGRDAAELPDAAWRDLAVWFAEAQLRQIADGAMLVLSRGTVLPEAPVLAAGIGRHLAAKLAARLGRPCRDFAAVLPPGCVGATDWLNHCAPAVAVSLLA